MRQPAVLVLFWMVGMATVAQASRHGGCCTAFSKVHVDRLMNSTRGRRVQCWWQGITEHCSINAVVLKMKRRYMCVNPEPQKMQNLLKDLCSTAAVGRGAGRAVGAPGRPGLKQPYAS